MDLTSSSYTASSSPTPPSFPATISLIQNSTSKDDNTCYITKTADRGRVSVPIIALIVLIHTAIFTSLYLVCSRYVIYQSRKNVARLRFEKLDDRLKQLRNHELKIRATLFEDQSQQDASELVQIGDLQNTTTGFGGGAMDHFANGFEAAKRKLYEISRRKFVKRY
ncbi:uncharacterized protein EAF01_010580 [Botrytis porri]|uniref:Transmembrane protein n=1 Tax=Botrytis porri TaxID=87229 RepID=A0A4Z1KNT3_9HELO|nr:uncharacterized protein EAF01_010580 [Botrytis porri]KAF7890771.1 hypothetical protein EAF01_010580 [Botrytis porri]TGO87757.1 hypothetical protein BPOR_0205g00020 [Botrytis porri]